MCISFVYRATDGYLKDNTMPEKYIRDEISEAFEILSIAAEIIDLEVLSAHVDNRAPNTPLVALP